MALNFPVTPSFVHNKGRGDAGGLVSIQSEAVMAGLSRSEHLGKAPLLICVFAAAVVGMLTFGAFHALAQDAGQSGAQTAFEVASVKLHVAGSGGGRSDPGKFVGTFSVTVLISMAYGLQADHQLVGPRWADTLFLDIDAKMPEGATREQIPRMIQTLLTDRLRLTVHQESRIMSVYELTVGKAGPKMKEVDPTQFNEILRLPRGFRGHLTMPHLTALLSERLGRYVLDSTGLKAIYDVDLQWMPDEAAAPAGASDPPPQPLPETTVPSDLFPAIQQQLGLKLESRRAPVKVVVVDHLERVPTEN